MATGISFEEFRENGAYYKGLLHTPSGVMCGLYSEEKEEILPFNFATLGYNKERGAFYVKKSAGSEFEELKLFDNPPPLSIDQLFELE